MEKFALGLAVGLVGGALATANSYKMRALVRKTQKEVQAKLDEVMDEKLCTMTEQEPPSAPMQEDKEVSVQKSRAKRNGKSAAHA